MSGGGIVMRLRPAMMAAAFLLPACSSQQVYNATSEWRAQQCARLEPREQEACRAQARASYEENLKNRDEASGKTQRP